MSFRSILRPMLAVASGFLLGYFAVYFFTAAPVNREIASVVQSKLGKDQISRGYFDIQLDETEIAKTDDGKTTLVVTLKALKDLPQDLVFLWNLHGDVEHSDGTLAGNVELLKKGQTQEFKIELKNFSKLDRKYISFQVLNESLHREVLISSRKEDSFEYLVQKNEMNGNDIEILNSTGHKKKKHSKFDLKKVIR